MKQPALDSAAALAGGILLGSAVNLSGVLLFLVTVGLVGLGFFAHWHQRPRLATVTLLGVLVAAGMMRYGQVTRDFPLNHISHFVHLGKSLTVTARITDLPDVFNDRTYLTVVVDSLSDGRKRVAASGKISVRLREPTSAFAYGDRIRFSGTIWPPPEAKNPGAFDYQRYLQAQEIFGLVYLSSVNLVAVQRGSELRGLKSFLEKSRAGIIRQFQTNFSHEESALLAGFLLGYTRDIPSEIYRLFRDTGTLHLLAVSGANVGLVVGLVWFLARLFLFPRRLTVVLVLAAIWFYAGLALFQPSVIRAAIMWSLGALAFWFYRTPKAVNIIGVAALGMLGFKPLWLFDVGFQLSFAATLGIVVFVPQVAEWVNRLPGYIRLPARFSLLPLAVSLIAQLATWPFIVYYFHRVSIVSPLANLCIVPLASLAMYSTIPFLAAAKIFPPLGHLVAGAAAKILGLIFFFEERFGADRAAAHVLGGCDLLCFAALGVLAGSLLALTFFPHRRWLSAALVLGMLNFLAWRSVLHESPSVRATFLEASPGRWLVVQAGSTAALFGSGGRSQIRYVVVPFLAQAGIQRVTACFPFDGGDSTRRALEELCREVTVNRFVWPQAAGERRADFPERAVAGRSGDSLAIVGIVAQPAPMLSGYLCRTRYFSILSVVRADWVTQTDFWNRLAVFAPTVVSLPIQAASPEVLDALARQAPATVVLVEGRQRFGWEREQMWRGATGSQGRLPQHLMILSSCGAVTLAATEKRLRAESYLGGRFLSRTVPAVHNR